VHTCFHVPILGHAVHGLFLGANTCRRRSRRRSGLQPERKASLSASWRHWMGSGGLRSASSLKESCVRSLARVRLLVCARLTASHCAVCARSRSRSRTRRDRQAPAPAQPHQHAGSGRGTTGSVPSRRRLDLPLRPSPAIVRAWVCCHSFQATLRVMPGATTRRRRRTDAGVRAPVDAVTNSLDVASAGARTPFSPSMSARMGRRCAQPRSRSRAAIRGAAGRAARMPPCRTTPLAVR